MNKINELAIEQLTDEDLRELLDRNRLIINKLLDAATAINELTPLAITAVSPSAGYVQAEATEVANQVKSIADRVDAIAALLTD